jgi:high-affinity iron transporter
MPQAGGLASAVVVGALFAIAAAPPSTPKLLERGKVVYETEGGCAACHGVTGEGNGPVSFALKPPPRNFTKDPFKGGDSVEQVFATITNGLPKTSMAGFPKITEADRWALAHYVLTFRPRK